MTRHHDGSVTVKINRRSGIAGANRKLAAMGVHARVAAGRSFPANWSCSIIPGRTVNLSAMLADAAQYAAEGNEAAAEALRTGEAAVANGTQPDVVYNCTGSDGTPPVRPTLADR